MTVIRLVVLKPSVQLIFQRGHCTLRSVAEAPCVLCYRTSCRQHKLTLLRQAPQRLASHALLDVASRVYYHGAPSVGSVLSLPPVESCRQTRRQTGGQTGGRRLYTNTHRKIILELHPQVFRRYTLSCCSSSSRCLLSLLFV